MKKRAKQRRFNRNIVVFLLVVVVFGFVVYLAVLQNPPSAQTQKTAAEYFEVVNAAVETTGQERIEQNGTIWVIYGVSFQFKPVLGDAHGVVVKSWANSQEQDVGDLSKGQARTVVLISPTGLPVRQKDGKFSVTVRIDSLEAKGPLTFALSP